MKAKQDAENKITAGRTSAEIQQKQSAFFSKVVGKYCLDGQENFEQYLEAIGEYILSSIFAYSLLICLLNIKNN